MQNDTDQYYRFLKSYLAMALRTLSEYKAAITTLMTIMTVGLEVAIITSFYSYHHTPQLIPIALRHASVPLISILFFLLLLVPTVPYGASFLAGWAYAETLGCEGAGPSVPEEAHSRRSEDEKTKKSGGKPQASQKRGCALALPCVLWGVGALVSAFCLPSVADSRRWILGLFAVLPALLWLPTLWVLAPLAGNEGATPRWWERLAMIVTGALTALLSISIVQLYFSLMAHRYADPHEKYGFFGGFAVWVLFILAYALPNLLFIIGALKGPRGKAAAQGLFAFAVLTFVGMVLLAGILPTGSLSGLLWRVTGYGGYCASYTEPGRAPRAVYVLLEDGRYVYVGMSWPKGVRAKETGKPAKTMPSNQAWPIVKRVPFNDVILKGSEQQGGGVPRCGASSGKAEHAAPVAAGEQPQGPR